MSRTALLEWRHDDAQFGAKVEAALERGINAVEDEARRRGFSGVRRNVFHDGRVVGREICYSDTLLIFMLKARRPQAFGEKRAP